MQLSPQQQAAVEHTGSPALVVAGAGSGKTRTLTAKFAHLVQSGMPPEHILAITFTNKAADEMKGRLIQMTGMGLQRFPGCGPTIVPASRSSRRTAICWIFIRPFRSIRPTTSKRRSRRCSWASITIRNIPIPCWGRFPTPKTAGIQGPILTTIPGRATSAGRCIPTLRRKTQGGQCR
jgi:hypothetical protein